MAGGWAPDGAEQAQIDASLDDALAFARQHLPSGESAHECAECGESIPEARRICTTRRAIMRLLPRRSG